MGELIDAILEGAAGLWGLAVEHAVWSIAAVLLIAALLRIMPRERNRPWRPGFFVLAPVVGFTALAGAGFAGVASFYLVVFGPAFLFDEWVGTPWITMFFGIGVAPAAGFLTLVGIMFLGDRLLGRV